MGISINLWDVVLVLGVAAQSLAVAYLYDPRWKAFVVGLPMPFTLATLSLGRPVDATNVTAIAVLLLFYWGVRLLYLQLGLRIVPAIVTAALLYSFAGWALARVIPDSDRAFWWACALVWLLGLALLLAIPPRDEPGHRSPLPLRTKLPVVVGVILGLVLAKHALKGFMTLFPMVSVVAAYEARHSLYTLARQLPVMMLTLIPLMIVSRLADEYLGLGGSLLAGWLVLFAFLPAVSRLNLRRFPWSRPSPPNP